MASFCFDFLLLEVPNQLFCVKILFIGVFGEVVAIIQPYNGFNYARTAEGLFRVLNYNLGDVQMHVISFNNLIYKVSAKGQSPPDELVQPLTAEAMKVMIEELNREPAPPAADPPSSLVADYHKLLDNLENKIQSYKEPELLNQALDELQIAESSSAPSPPLQPH